MARMTVRAMMVSSTTIRGQVEITLTGYADTNELGALERVCLNSDNEVTVIGGDEPGVVEVRQPEMVKVEISRV